MNSCSESCDHSFDLCICINLIQTCFLYIQDFSTQRQDRLRCTASRGFCGTARGISLDQEDLTVFSDPCRCSLPVFQAGTSPPELIFFWSDLWPFLLLLLLFVPSEISLLSVCDRRILLQENLKLSADNVVHCSTRFTVSELLLGLTLKLRLSDLNTDNRCQTFTNVIT